MENFSQATRLRAKILDWNIPNAKQERPKAAAKWYVRGRVSK
jgi:hypothetical protein